MLKETGDRTRALGWFARATRIHTELPEACAEHGWVLVPQALQAIGSRDLKAAYDAFGRAVQLGERFDDVDLVCFARHGEGRALLRMGRVERGIALLDEVMVGLEAGSVSPMVTGVVYCSALEACEEISDLQRARSWTATLNAWCEGQEGLVPFRGQCLVQRSKILRQHGDWAEAMAEAQRAADWLTTPPERPAAGAAFYQRAELHRLRGEFDEAEAAYAEATSWGRSPQPGLALLRLVQGRIEAARSAIERMLAEGPDPITRSKALPAYVEILVAAGEGDAAVSGADELLSIARELDVNALHAKAAHAQGAARLAVDRPGEALPRLRSAQAAWEELEVPYEAARSRALVAAACRALGDDDTAELHEAAARTVFERLSAKSDLERLDAMGAPEREALLTPRELEVLRLVAAGHTNRDIGTTLGISERTVERHVSNFFDKLGVSTRAAATAYAYEHELL
jgi:ATP/maltotriose-dependent transcriptional regulator MalT